MFMGSNLLCKRVHNGDNFRTSKIDIRGEERYPGKGSHSQGFVSRTSQRIGYHLADMSARPPSMEWMPPVIQPASSEHRKAHSAAISSGRPTRPRG